MASVSGQIRTWLIQLYESRLRYLKSKLLLHSLREIVDSEKAIGSAAAKIRKVLLFGDTNEYLDLPQQTPTEYCRGERTLLGILKISDYDGSVALNDEEKRVVLDSLKENFRQKNELISEVFDVTPRKVSLENHSEELKKLLYSVKSVVSSTSVEVARNMCSDIDADIRKCYEELGNIYSLLEILVDFRLHAVEPVNLSALKLTELRKEITLAGSRELLGALKKEFFSDEGIKAMEIIHSSQVEETEMKKQKLKELREAISEYEELKSDGFDELLKEYMDVSRQRKEKEQLKDEYLIGFE